MISRFLSPTVQGELSSQSRRQPPCFILGYPIQLISLFNQAFLFISDHLPECIGNPKGLLDHLVSLRPFRSSALYGASWIPHYVDLPPGYKAGGPKPCSFIRRHHYLVAMEGWSWSLYQGGRALLRLASRASCYRRSSE